MEELGLNRLIQKGGYSCSPSFKLLFITLVAVFSILWALCPASCQSGKRKLKTFNPKRLKLIGEETYSFSLTRSLDQLIIDSTDSTLYDPITIMHLRLLKEEASPLLGIEEIDPYTTRKVVEKAFAVQTSQSLIRLVRSSELKDTFRDIERGFETLTSFFRYSLQNTGDGFVISRENRGDKLIELDMKFNLSKGAEPQFQIGDNVRFKYDWFQDSIAIEFGINF